jgi:lyso-ornithine lipid O-acyltransferase
MLAPLWKGLRIVEHLTIGAAVAVAVAVGQRLGYRIAWLDPVVSWWYRRLLRCLSVRLQAEGSIAPGALLVGNHVSWLDIPVVGTQGPVRFLSKAEVRRWPLIGWMSELVGTLFITRGANQVSMIVQQIRARILDGHPVVVFPEGTTSDGRQVYRFHPRLFAICQEAELAVQPVALRYGLGPEPDPIAPFVGDDTLVTHLWRLLSHPGLDVRVSFLDPFPVADLDRRGMADTARNAIAKHLGMAASKPAGHAGGAPRPGQPRVRVSAILQADL